jgi:hypothetical protein
MAADEARVQNPPEQAIHLHNNHSAQEAIRTRKETPK